MFDFLLFEYSSKDHRFANCNFSTEYFNSMLFSENKERYSHLSIYLNARHRSRLHFLVPIRHNNIGSRSWLHCRNQLNYFENAYFYEYCSLETKWFHYLSTTIVCLSSSERLCLNRRVEKSCSNVSRNYLLKRVSISVLEH